MTSVVSAAVLLVVVAPMGASALVNFSTPVDDRPVTIDNSAGRLPADLGDVVGQDAGQGRLVPVLTGSQGQGPGVGGAPSDAVPEPSAMALFGLGLLAAGTAWRKRR